MFYGTLQFILRAVLLMTSFNHGNNDSGRQAKALISICFLQRQEAVGAVRGTEVLQLGTVRTRLSWSLDWDQHFRCCLWASLAFTGLSKVEPGDPWGQLNDSFEGDGGIQQGTQDIFLLHQLSLPVCFLSQLGHTFPSLHVSVSWHGGV